MKGLSWLWFQGWFWTRPKSVRMLIRKLPPSKTYIVNPTKQLATIYSYSEDGTVTVCILPDSEQPFTRGCAGSEGYKVFGYKPNDLRDIF